MALRIGILWKYCSLIPCRSSLGSYFLSWATTDSPKWWCLVLDTPSVMTCLFSTMYMAIHWVGWWHGTPYPLSGCCGIKSTHPSLFPTPDKLMDFCFLEIYRVVAQDHHNLGAVAAMVSILWWFSIDGVVVQDQSPHILAHLDSQFLFTTVDVLGGLMLFRFLSNWFTRLGKSSGWLGWFLETPCFRMLKVPCKQQDKANQSRIQLSTQ